MNMSVLDHCFASSFKWGVFSFPFCSVLYYILYICYVSKATHLGSRGLSPAESPLVLVILHLPYRVFEDEIQQLRDQLRETVDENGRLYKLLKERDFEIKHLKKKIEEDRFAFTGNFTSVLWSLPGA